jgi:hypothetical protein
MFERYTQQARRVIFFARYEASVFAASSIQTEHLLLALLREDGASGNTLSGNAAVKIRAHLEARGGPASRPGLTDLPFSTESMKALRYADEESAAMQHSSIDCGHLLLGLLRIDTGRVATALREAGIGYTEYRKSVAAVQHPPPGSGGAPAHTSSGPLRQSARDLMRLLHIVTAREYHDWQSATPEVSGRRERWGHLIALAAAHRQWFERALSESEITESGYPESNWTLAPLYDSKSRRDLFGVWSLLNRRIIQSIGDNTRGEDQYTLPHRLRGSDSAAGVGKKVCGAMQNNLRGNDVARQA